MRKGLAFAGMSVALTTPFRDGLVDVAALRSQVEFQIEAGATCLCPVGTTGESPTLTHEEHERVISEVVQAAAGRIKVMPGTGSNSTSEALRLTRWAAREGADAALVVAPYYNKPTQEGLNRHFRAMIDEGGLPAMLYHIPSRGSAPIEIETVARVAEAGGVVGLKETGGVDRITRLCADTDVPVFSGDDGLTLPMMALGAVGVVSVTSNVRPRDVVRLVRAMAASDLVEARRSHDALTPLVDALFLESNPIPVKQALAMEGHLEEATVRLPLVDASPYVVDALRAALDAVPA